MSLTPVPFSVVSNRPLVFLMPGSFFSAGQKYDKTRLALLKKKEEYVMLYTSNLFGAA